MIHYLKITDLFGVIGNNKEVDFKGNITIIVGKNGSGKTTVLDILNIIVNRTFNKLLKYKFDTIELITDEGQYKIINQKDSILIARLDVENVAFNVQDNQLSKIKLNELKNLLTDLSFENYRNISEFTDDMGFISKFFILIRKGETDERELNKVFYSFSLSINPLYFPTYRRLETDLLELLDEPNTKRDLFFPTRRFIEEHLTSLVTNLKGTIVGLSNKDINKIIASKWHENLEKEKILLNSLVKDFFFSLLQPPTGNFLPSNVDDVESILSNIFLKTGMFEKNDKSKKEEIRSYAENLKQASSKLEDSEDQLGALRILLTHEKVEKLLHMYKKTEVEIKAANRPFEDLKKTLNRFLKKKVSISDGNLKFEHDLTYEDLSAGEKQLVAMFVYIKLSLSDNSIVIIDEPELSLHVTWQRKFLSALVSDIQPIQYIVSTHSPFIISDFGEHVQPLGPEDYDEDDIEDEVEMYE
ncbi:AAA family ATPase [Brevibacillus dissolubilis]|uniref:AAA family ATPase n=1 Tax=Brevibacillus dissolubilis TaxID=1844116 RepID=UPI0011172F1F|nr:AAA family ATPase [Brevibacillus dissolubilis]